MSFVCLIRAAECDVVNLFLSARLWPLMEGGRLSANGGVTVPLSSKVGAQVLKHGHLRLINDCFVDPVSMIFELARAGEIDWAAPLCVGWFLYDFKDAAIISIPEW